MAKRKKRKSVYRRAKAHYTKHKKSYGLLGVLMSAGIYGAFRAKVSNYLSQYTSRIPLGNVSDEVGMGLLCILGKKFIGNKVPMAKKVFDAGLYIECARIGEAAATGQLGLGTTSGSNNDLFNGGGY